MQDSSTAIKKQGQPRNEDFNLIHQVIMFHNEKLKDIHQCSVISKLAVKMNELVLNGLGKL